MSRSRLLSSVLFGAAMLALAGCGQSFNSGSVVGTSGAPSATINTTALAFGTEPLGQSTATQSVTVSVSANGANLTFLGVAITGANASSFLASTNCGSVVTRGTSCSASVAFSPTAVGPLTATLVITDNSANSPQLVTLTGTGSANGPVLSLSATSLTFTTLPVGQASTQTLSLTNIGTSSLSLYGFTLGGANATSFALSGSCLTTATLAPNGSPCFLTVTYAPTVAGSLAATINVNDSAPNLPQSISLASK